MQKVSISRSFLKVFSVMAILAMTLVACSQKGLEPEEDVPSVDFSFKISEPETLPYEYLGADAGHTVTEQVKAYKSGTILAALGSLLVNQAETAVLYELRSYATGKVKDFFKGLFGLDSPTFEETTNVKLDQIISSLGEINQKLDVLYNNMIEIQKQVDETEINLLSTQVQDLMSKTNTMYYHNLECYDSLMKLIDAEASDDEFTKVIDTWAHTVINGSEARFNALSYVQNLIDPLMYFTYHERKINMIQVYDLSVFDAYPWEYLGYDDREAFRAKIAAEAVLSLSFAYIYYDANGMNNMRENCVQAICKLKEFVGANEVEYNMNESCCQIRGAYVKFPSGCVWNRSSTGVSFVMSMQNLRYGTTWYENEWLFGSFDLQNPSNTSDKITEARASQLSVAEIESIVNYYKKTSPDKSLMSVFTEAGLVFPSSFEKDSEIYLGSNETQTCLWITDNSNYHEYYSEFSNVYDIGHAVSECCKKIAYVHYKGTYSFKYPNDYYNAAVNVPGYSGNYRHYRRWILDTQATSFDGPGDGFVLFKSGAVTRYTDFYDE